MGDVASRAAVRVKQAAEDEFPTVPALAAGGFAAGGLAAGKAQRDLSAIGRNLESWAMSVSPQPGRSPLRNALSAVDNYATGGRQLLRQLHAGGVEGSGPGVEGLGFRV